MEFNVAIQNVVLCIDLRKYFCLYALLNLPRKAIFFAITETKSKVFNFFHKFKL
jgi:hypothetical protein